MGQPPNENPEALALELHQVKLRVDLLWSIVGWWKPNNWAYGNGTRVWTRAGTHRGTTYSSVGRTAREARKSGGLPVERAIAPTASVC